MLKLAVSGDQHFLTRYRGLVEALTAHMSRVDVVPSGNLMQLAPFRALARIGRTSATQPAIGRYIRSYDRRAAGFRIRSRQTERKLSRLRPQPDFVLHVFSSFAPFWRGRDIPYGMYLDFTMAAARREWPPWAAFRSDAECQRWIEYEREAYARATVLFTMGANARDSLISDYGMSADKVVVVGSGGNYRRPYEGPKTFGSKQILFQGSEFERKGGDVLLAAFADVRRVHPAARLVIVGTERDVAQPGVECLGYVTSRDAMERLFLESDLVVAPARCDPFTAFVIEGFNYGVPCVVTRASGVSEAVSDGANGVVVDGNDPAAIAAAATPLLEDTAALVRMSHSARALVRSRLNWDAIAATMSVHLVGRDGRR